MIGQIMFQSDDLRATIFVHKLVFSKEQIIMTRYDTPIITIKKVLFSFQTFTTTLPPCKRLANPNTKSKFTHHARIARVILQRFHKFLRQVSSLEGVEGEK